MTYEFGTFGCQIFSQFWKSDMSKYGRCISESPLEFEITRADCISNSYG